MKKTVINACRLMTAVMVAGAGGYVHANDSLEVSFNLNARYSNVTCDTALVTSGDINGSEINFGTFSSDQVYKTKNVVLTLDCSQGSDLPDTVRVSFSVQSPADVDSGQSNRLYPVKEEPSPHGQNNLYFDWAWGDNINDTLQQVVSNQGYTGVTKDAPVDLSKKQIVYEVNKNTPTKAQSILHFPLKITRGVKDTNALEAGNYSAAVTMSVSYD